MRLYTYIQVGKCMSDLTISFYFQGPSRAAKAAKSKAHVRVPVKADLSLRVGFLF